MNVTTSDITDATRLVNFALDVHTAPGADEEYAELLFVHGHQQRGSQIDAVRAHKCSSWLGPLAADAEHLLAGGHRIAQEAVGLELLQSLPNWT
jgi:hypothetical protein